MRDQVPDAGKESKPSQQKRQGRKEKQIRTEGSHLSTMKGLTPTRLGPHLYHRNLLNHVVARVSRHPKRHRTCMTGRMKKTRPGSNNHFLNTCLAQE